MFSLSVKKKGKVFVGLSGGVDSAVSAALLKREGYEVVGVFIRIQIPGYPCPAAQDRIEAMRVAAHLRIPFIEIDLSEEYQKRVFAVSMREFERGRTPNPDTLCNREIKFGTFYEYAVSHGADFVATGHYAQTQAGEMHAGVDDTKDQSYFLFMVPEDHLANTLFPVGGLHKTEVRRLAKRFKLPNSARHDSQGLCFLGDISLTDMLTRETHPVPGEVLAEDGSVIGRHLGVQLYTLGQRHGFELLVGSSDSTPQYVIGKDVARNTLTVSPERFPRGAARTVLGLVDTNWIGEVVDGACMARFRYRQKLIPATLVRKDGMAVVTLSEPHYAPLGQSLVLYTGERCLGGGTIDTADVSA